MCHRHDDDVGADGQRVLVAVAVGVGVRELLPAVAQVEPAVDDSEPSVERDSRQAGGARAEVLRYALQNGQKIEGTLSGIVYVRADPAAEPERYLLHKRDKGDPGTDLKSLVYVCSVQLGAKALEEGKRKAAGPASRKASAASGKGRS